MGSTPLSSPGKAGFVLRSILFAKPAPRGGKGIRDCKTPNTHIRCLAGGWGNDLPRPTYHERPRLVKFMTVGHGGVVGVVGVVGAALHVRHESINIGGVAQLSIFSSVYTAWWAGQR